MPASSFGSSSAITSAAARPSLHGGSPPGTHPSASSLVFSARNIHARLLRKRHRRRPWLAVLEGDLHRRPPATPPATSCCRAATSPTHTARAAAAWKSDFARNSDAEPTAPLQQRDHAPLQLRLRRPRSSAPELLPTRFQTETPPSSSSSSNQSCAQYAAVLRRCIAMDWT